MIKTSTEAFHKGREQSNHIQDLTAEIQSWRVRFEEAEPWRARFEEADNKRRQLVTRKGELLQQLSRNFLKVEQPEEHDRNVLQSPAQPTTTGASVANPIVIEIDLPAATPGSASAINSNQPLQSGPAALKAAMTSNSTAHGTTKLGHPLTTPAATSPRNVHPQDSQLPVHSLSASP